MLIIIEENNNEVTVLDSVDNTKEIISKTFAERFNKVYILKRKENSMSSIGNIFYMDNDKYEEIEKGVYRALGKYHINDINWLLEKSHQNFSMICEKDVNGYNILYLGDIRYDTFMKLKELADICKKNSDKEITTIFGVLDDVSYGNIEVGVLNV